ncbi:MAG: riboflavin synthase subunit alpha [Acidimicrobiia bacterium]
MFTGLIEATGTVAVHDGNTDGVRLRVHTPLAAELTVGDSIAVNGVCLTAVDVDASSFAADISPQTLRVTTAGDWQVGRTVNLERPLRADARLGGHFVLGHVDGVSTIAGIRQDGESWWVTIALPSALAPLLIPKGSITVDGISLTVADLADDTFSVQIIPHTWTVTTLGERRVGDRINLEADVLGKYVARLSQLGALQESHT